MVSWSYIVTNDGDVDLTNIAVTDSILGPITTIGYLAAGESITTSATATAIIGQYSNTATAEATYTDADNDVAFRTDSDDSHYFGADPSISLQKTTSDGYGNEGDGIGVIPGQSVTWTYYLENTGNVALEHIQVTDDVLGVIGFVTLLNPGDLVTLTATGTIEGGWYKNIGTGGCIYVDGVGNEVEVIDSDESSYYGLFRGYLTNASLCEFGDYFKLGFSPDIQNWPGHYKLSSSNPGQFSYNVFYISEGEPLEVMIPYPFVTQGAMPVHIYDGVYVSERSDGLCFTPINELMILPIEITLLNQDPLEGASFIIEGLPEGEFIYLTIHLDFGLKNTQGWVKGKSDDANYDEDFGLDYCDIPNINEYVFSSSVEGSNDSLWNTNSFKNIKGFGGLVLNESGEGIEGETVSLFSEAGIWIEDMQTDVNGWYWSEYVHKGKTATYVLKWNENSISVTIGGKIKFGEGIFTDTSD